MLSLSPVSDPIRDALNAQVRHFSILVGLATLVVAIGVALEGVELLHDAVAWIKRRRLREKELAVRKELTEIFPAGEVRLRAESNSDHPRWVKRFTRIGLIVVVVGVVAEWRCGAKLEDAHNAVHEYDLAKLTEANQKAGDAEATAKGFDAKIAESNAKAKSAEAMAEAERLARVKIEAAVAWRSLTETQKKDIGVALSRFGATWNGSMWFNSPNTEAEMFADDIAEALRSAHGARIFPPAGLMEMRETGGLGDPTATPFTGVEIQSTKDSLARGLADTLIDELHKCGFDANRQKDPPFGEAKTPTIWVRVEPRPKGPQGEYKLQAEQEAKAKKTSTSTH